MTPHDLIAAFENLADAPDGVKRLREFILELAVRGRLVPQDANDEPASALLEQLRAGRKRLLDKKEISEPRHPTGSPVRDEPYELPSAWEWIRLGDAGAIVGGGTPKSDETAYWADGHAVPWLTPADMRHQPSRYITRGKRDITTAGLASSGAQLLPAGTVLFSSRAPIGHVGIAASPLSTNQGFKSCVPYVSPMSEYLYLFLRKVGPEVNAAASGTTFKEVTGKDVALIPLPLPPLAEQHRIVARVDELMGLLDRLDAARSFRDTTRVAARDSVLASLRQADTPDDVEVAWNRFAERMDELVIEPSDITPLRQTVLELAMRGRLVRQDPADEPARALLEEIAMERVRLLKEGKIRAPRALPELSGEFEHDLPGSWCWAQLASIVPWDLTDGDWVESKDQDPSGEVRLTQLADVGVGRFLDKSRRFLTTNTAARLRCTYLEQGDVLIARLPEPLGRSCVFPGLPQPAITVVDVAIARCQGASVSPHFLAHLLNSPGIALRVKSLAAGTTRARVSTGNLRGVVVPVPPLAEQYRIVARVDELMGVLDRLEARLMASRTMHAEFAAAAVHYLET